MKNRVELFGSVAALSMIFAASPVAAQSVSSAYGGKAQKECDRSNKMVLSGIEARADAMRDLVKVRRDLADARNQRERTASEIERLSAEFADLNTTKPDASDPQLAKEWAAKLEKVSRDWARNVKRNEEADKQYRKAADAEIETQADVDSADITILQGRAMKSEVCYAYRPQQVAGSAFSVPARNSFLAERREPRNEYFAAAPVADKSVPAGLPNETQRAEPVREINAPSTEIVDGVSQNAVRTAQVDQQVQQPEEMAGDAGENSQSAVTTENPVVQPVQALAEPEVKPENSLVPAAPPAVALQDPAYPDPISPVPEPMPMAAVEKASAPLPEKRESQMKGLRVEGRVGYQFPKLTDITVAPPSTTKLDEKVIYGAEVGFDINVIGGLTIGPFAEYSHASVPDPLSANGVGMDDSFGLGGRVGVEVARGFALYGKAAYSDVKFDTGNDTVSASIQRSAVRYGGGTEVSLFGGFYVSGDYMRADFGDIGGAEYVREDLNLGLGFRF